MPTKEKTASAYMDTRKNKNGFSFISVLAAISIIFMTIPFTAYLIKALDYESSYNQLSVNQFFLFLRDEAAESIDMAVSPSKLRFTLQDESTSTIEQYDDVLIRQVDNKGFEIFLREVQDVQFDTSEYGFEVSISMPNGDQFEKTIRYYD